ncbi:MAG: hypothetical protein RIC06_22850 [Cyclobacteriaceae bacterium]
MRKISSIFFILFYSLIATGFSVNLHYCLGELADIEVYGNSNICCCGEEADMSGCCDNETVVLETAEDQIPTANNIEITQFTTIVEVLFDLSDPLFIQNKQAITRAGGLSPPGSRPIWLVNCKLILYG